MMKKDVTPAGCVFAIFYLPVLMFVSAVANGYALSVLWRWFIVPIFYLPALNIPQALGLALVISMLTKDFDSNSDKESDDTLTDVLIKATMKVFIKPAFALLFGWIVLQFMN